MRKKRLPARPERRLHARGGPSPASMVDMRGVYQVSPVLTVYVGDQAPHLGHGEVWLDNYAANTLAGIFDQVREG